MSVRLLRRKDRKLCMEAVHRDVGRCGKDRLLCVKNGREGCGWEKGVPAVSLESG